MSDSGEGGVRRPESVVGVGGVGSGVVDRLLATPWVDVAGSGDADDTDGGWTDDALVVDVDERDAGRATRLNPLADVSAQHRRAGLLDPETVRAVQRETGSRVWWLESPERSPCAPLDDTAEGLRGRRAVGRATAAVSLALGDRLEAALDALPGEVYVVAGLGGGTGAGMLFDVADRLAARDRTDEAGAVHLVGVLPGPGAPLLARANAHATLSELEHRMLTDQGAFETLLLVDGGADRATVETAGVYTICSHATLPRSARERLSPGSASGPPAYAPFTVVASHAVRFDTADVADGRAALESDLLERRGRLAVEIACCESLSGVILDSGEDAAGSTLRCVQRGKRPPSRAIDRWQVATLRDRVDRLRDFLAAESLETMTDGRATTWRSRLDDRVTTASDDVQMVLRATDLAAASGDEVDSGADGGSAGATRSLAALLDDYVDDELTAIRSRLAVQCAAAELDPAVADHLRLLADPTTPATSVLEDADADLAAVNERIDEQRRLAEERVDEALTAWRRETWDDVERLCRLGALEADLETLLARAERSVRETVVAMAAAETASELHEATDGWDRDLVTLDDRLDAVGLDPVGPRYQRAVETLEPALTDRLAYESVPSLLRVLRRSKLEAHRDGYVSSRAALEGSVVELSDLDAPLDCRVDTDPLHAVGERVDGARDSCLDRICAAYARHVEAVRIDGQRVVEALDSPWSLPTPAAGDDDARRAREAVRTRLLAVDGFESDERDSDDAESVERLFERLGVDGDGPAAEGLRAVGVDPLDELERRLGDLESTYERIADERPVFERFERLATHRSTDPSGTVATHADGAERGDDSPQGDGDETGDSGESSASTASNAAEPTRRLQLALPGVDGDATVSEVVGTGGVDPEAMALRGLAPWTRSLAGGSIPLATAAATAVESATGGAADGECVVHASRRGVTVVGSALGTDDDPVGGVAAAAVGRALEGAGVTTRDDHQSVTHGMGGPGDVSAVSFVGGVTLDTLAGLRGATGYATAYETAVEATADEGRVRHAHGLDGLDGTLGTDGEIGAFTVRESLLDPATDPTELGATDADVVDALRSRYRVTRFESTVVPD